MTGVSPNLRILAQLMATEEKELKRPRLYTNLDTMEFSYSKEDRSIGLSRILESIILWGVEIERLIWTELCQIQLKLVVHDLY